MIIEAKGLTKRFARHEAVRGVDLAVPEGAAVALIGPNGAGKTTTLRLLMNLLRPERGEARVLGVDSRRLSHRELARIGYVAEATRLPASLTVGQYFDYLRPLYPTWDTSLEKDLRARYDLPPGRKLKALSHGMRVKAMLAAALPFWPELLVLDEPLSGLDPLVRDEVMEGLLDQAGRMTILISSHELPEIEGFATHVAFMEDGRVRFQEPTETLQGRFREVTVTLTDGASVPPHLPESWGRLKTLGPMVSFVESAFTTEPDLARKIALKLGETSHLQVQPLSLRDIGKALIAAGRKEAAQ